MAQVDTSYDKILKAVQMIGIPSVIVAALFWFLGMEIWPFFKDQLTQSLNMQQSVTNAITKQSDNEQKQIDNAVKVTTALENTLKQVNVNAEAIQIDIQNTKKVLELMENATEFMKDTPTQRAKMIMLLEQLLVEQQKTYQAINQLNK